MKAAGFTKLYDTLTLDERFRLRIRALGRGDQADWERLDRSCPLNESRDYCARLDASDVLTLCTLVELLPILAKLDMVAAFGPLVEYLEGAARDSASMAFLDGYAAGWKAADKRGKPPAVSDDELTAAADRACRVGAKFSEALEQVTGMLAGRARTSRDAMAAFAEDELGLSLADLLAAWGGYALNRLAEHAEALDAAEPNADDLALAGRVLNPAWRRHGLNDPTAEIDDDLRARFEAALWGADDAVGD
jgi:hypothetical protein